MYKFDPRTLTKNENYKMMSGLVIPRPIALVTTRSTVNGITNAAPFSYFNAVSSDPPLLSLSIGRKNGQMKDSARNTIENGELVIHICDETIAEEMNATSAPLEAHSSELELTSLHTVQSEVVSVPSIQEARARFECRLQHHIPIKNDHGDIVQDFLLVRIVCYHLKEEIFDKEKGYINAEELQPISRLAGNAYAKLGEQFVLKRPKA